MNFKTIHVIAVCFALFSGPIAASAGELYLWTDEKGGKHITDQPPEEPAKIINKSSYRRDSPEEIRRYQAEQKAIEQRRNAETRIQQQINNAKGASDNNRYEISNLEAEIENKESELQSLIRRGAPRDLDALNQWAIEIAAKKGEINRLTIQFNTIKNEDKSKLSTRS